MKPIIWITGQPGSGKTTLAQAIRDELGDVVIIDGDDIRTLLPNPGYSREGRLTNVDRAQALAAWEQEKGNQVVVALVSPYEQQRERFKAFRVVIEVYLTCSEERGREHFFVEDYEPPRHPQLRFDTACTSVQREVRDVLGTLSATARRT